MHSKIVFTQQGLSLTKTFELEDSLDEGYSVHDSKDSLRNTHNQSRSTILFMNLRNLSWKPPKKNASSQRVATTRNGEQDSFHLRELALTSNNTGETPRHLQDNNNNNNNIHSEEKVLSRASLLQLNGSPTNRASAVMKRHSILNTDLRNPYFQPVSTRAQRMKDKMKVLLTQMDQQNTSQVQEYGLQKESLMSIVQQQQQQQQQLNSHSHSHLKSNTASSKIHRMEEKRINMLMEQEKLKKEISVKLAHKHQEQGNNVLQQQKAFFDNFKQPPILGELGVASQMSADRKDLRIKEIQRDKYLKVWKKHKLQPKKGQEDQQQQQYQQQYQNQLLIQQQFSELSRIPSSPLFQQQQSLQQQQMLPKSIKNIGNQQILPSMLTSQTSAFFNPNSKRLISRMDSKTSIGNNL